MFNSMESSLVDIDEVSDEDETDDKRPCDDESYDESSAQSERKRIPVIITNRDRRYIY